MPTSLGFIMILSKDEAKRMRNTKRFGKVRTNEEYLMLCRLEKEINSTNKGIENIGDTRKMYRLFVYAKEVSRMP